MTFRYNDGGRAAAGYTGHAGDCVTRAIAIATGKPYQEVYDAINALATGERFKKRRRCKRGRSSARSGVFAPTYRRYLGSLGLQFTATMGFGTGCRVHLRDGELPMGRLVVRLSRHLTTVIDGVIHDTHDPSRDGTRCVYGYWRAA